MISGLGSYQSANISLSSQGAKNGAQNSGAAPARNLSIGGALDAHINGTGNAFNQISSQINDAFLDLIEQSKTDDRGSSRADRALSEDDIQSFVSSFSFSSELSVDAQMSNDKGGSASLNLAASSGLSFEIEKTNGVMTSFSLSFDMSTELSFQARNDAGGYSMAQYSNVQSFSIDFSIGEDKDGNRVQSLNIAASSTTQVAMLRSGPMGEEGSLPSLKDMFGITGTNNGTSGQAGANGSSLTKQEPDFAAEAAVEMMKEMKAYMAAQREEMLEELEAERLEEKRLEAVETDDDTETQSISDILAEAVEDMVDDQDNAGFTAVFKQETTVSQFSASFYRPE